MDAQSIDLIVLATSTPDQTFPATAVTVQAGLGIHHGAAFDLQAVCSGFVYALATADGMLRSGMFKRALVIGGETFSRILDWKDRTTCVLFGDGAGAVVLEAQEQAGTKEDRGILTSYLRSDGRYRDKLYVDGGPSSTQTDGLPAHGWPRGLPLRGRCDLGGGRGRAGAIRLRRRRHRLVRSRIRPTSGLSTASPGSSGSTPEQVVLTLDRHGNTSAASIPLALNDAVADRRIKRGDLVMLEAMGGGFTWGATLIRW